jgi:2-oxoglutarate ferredoxin oxidoreductase subunit gamma
MDSVIYEFPFTEIAMEKLGSILPTNIMTLGFLVKKTNVVSEKSLKEALKNSVRPQFLEMNLKALKIGFKLASEE